MYKLSLKNIACCANVLQHFYIIVWRRVTDYKILFKRYCLAITFFSYICKALDIPSLPLPQLLLSSTWLAYLIRCPDNTSIYEILHSKRYITILLLISSSKSFGAYKFNYSCVLAFVDVVTLFKISVTVYPENWVTLSYYKFFISAWKQLLSESSKCWHHDAFRDTYSCFSVFSKNTYIESFRIYYKCLELHLRSSSNYVSCVCCNKLIRCYAKAARSLLSDSIFLMSPKSYSFHSQTIIEFVDNFYERRQARYLTIVPLTEFDFTLT